MSCGVGGRHSLALTLLRLWRRLAAAVAAPFRPLPWETPCAYAAGAALKKKKKLKKKTTFKNRNKNKMLSPASCLWFLAFLHSGAQPSPTSIMLGAGAARGLFSSSNCWFPAHSDHLLAGEEGRLPRKQQGRGAMTFPTQVEGVLQPSKELCRLDKKKVPSTCRV